MKQVPHEALPFVAVFLLPQLLRLLLFDDGHNKPSFLHRVEVLLLKRDKVLFLIFSFALYLDLFFLSLILDVFFQYLARLLLILLLLQTA